VGAGTTTYRVGERFIGVRSTDPAVAARLASLLPSLVVDDVEAPCNLSLKLGGDDGPVRDFHLLYRGQSTFVRTSSIGRLLRATLSHLDGYLDPVPGTARLNTRVLVRDGEAVLVDGVLGSHVQNTERRLAQLGYRVADVYGAALDRQTLELVLWQPRVDIDADALASLDEELPVQGSELGLIDARFPLRRVLSYIPDSNEDRPSVRRLAELAPLATDMAGRLRAEDLELVRHVDEAGLVTRLARVDDGRLVAALKSLA